MMKKFLNFNSADRLDEIVFANRNKAYGAYALRNEESTILKKSLFIGVSLFITLVAVPLVMNALKTETIEEPPIYGTIDFIPIPDTPDKPEPVKPEPQVVKPVETFVAVVPTPTKNPPIETPAPTISDYDGAKPGFKEVDGEKPTVRYEPIVPPTRVVPTTPTEKPAVDNNEPAIKVDIEAKFSGGINAFREKVGRNFDISSFEGSGEKMTAQVTFIVEKDGSISNIKAAGMDAKFNKEAERTVKAVKGKWQPAKLKGEIVRSYFKIPITIQFE